MLRGWRVAVWLLSNPSTAAGPLSGALKRSTKRFLRGEHAYDQFEPVGNFVFRLSLRETFKIVTALGYYGVAWKTMNVFWHGAVCGASRQGQSLRLAASGLQSARKMPPAPCAFCRRELSLCSVSRRIPDPKSLTS